MSSLFKPLKKLLNHRIKKRTDIDNKDKPIKSSPRAPPTRTPSLAAALASPGVTTHSQSQSSFFARLPSEIRLLIFEYVLGGATYHLSIGGKDQYAYSWTCGSPDACRALRTVDCARSGGHPPTDACSRAVRGLLAAPLTCRKIYFESLHLLYQRNAFVTMHPGILGFLRRVFPPTALAAVRHISFLLAFSRAPLPGSDVPSDYTTSFWIKVWSVVAQMTALETLCVSVQVKTRVSQLWVAHEEEILGPLRAVTAPSTFEIYLPYTDAPCQVESLPCRVYRTSPEAL